MKPERSSTKFRNWNNVCICFMQYIDYDWIYIYV